MSGLPYMDLLRHSHVIWNDVILGDKHALRPMRLLSMFGVRHSIPTLEGCRLLDLYFMRILDRVDIQTGHELSLAFL
jgi:hypothetical protein